MGFFIPYRHAASVRPFAYDALEPVFRDAEVVLRHLLSAVDGYRRELEELDGPPPAPRFRQDWFPRLDGAIAYTLARSGAPARIVEVGSGHSTRFLARAIRDGAEATKLTAIDPGPRASLAGLDLDHRTELLHETPQGLFRSLGAGDMLFVDSSHILMPGSDVDLLVNRILPELAPGVLVHIHDVFLPDPYPAVWDWRGYNEQLGVAPLLWTGAFELVWASHYVTSRHPEWLSDWLRRLPLSPGVFETSLWLRKGERRAG